MACTNLSADEGLLDQLQRAAFDYFPTATNPHNGLVADNSRANSPVSIAVVGFALSAYPIAVERGWMRRDTAVQYCLSALRFFRDSDQSGGPAATGFKGFYYHFLDIETGARVWQSELSMVDTALLIGGMLTASQYFDAATPDESDLRALVDFLYRRVDWRWAQDDADTIRQGWKPECGFLHYGWEGYSEAILLYALALGSPTHPIASDCYRNWTLTYQWENLYDIDCLYAGPLFIHQFSHAWIDFRGIADEFMREKRSDYFENSRRAVCIQREYARRNPREFAGYDENCWGLSACDGPSDERPDTPNERRRLYGYAARSVPYGPDDGTLSAASVLASLPFAPEAVMHSLRNMLERYPEALPGGRLTSGFNPTLAAADGRAWISAGHYGLDQGIVVMMIENHRSERVWQLMRENPYIRAGLHGAGFRGGWLRQSMGRGAR
ncbi:MAG TPA: glucoamylase family protein [Rudaea sp.]|nr:glucoamylase family protein [Rudaea sp.]